MGYEKSKLIFSYTVSNNHMLQILYHVQSLLVVYDTVLQLNTAQMSLVCDTSKVETN